MFQLKSQVFAVCHLLVTIQAQSYFHTNLGNSGSYSSITYGASANRPAAPAPPPPPRPAYSAPQPAYSPPPPKPAYAAAPQPAYAPPPPKPAYVAPQPAYAPPPPKPAYVAPQPAYAPPPQPAYGAPQPRAEALAYDNEQCILDYPDKYAEVCVPTLKTECVNEQIKDGLRLYDEESCYTVTKSVCTEAEEVELVDVCAVAYKLHQVAAEAKLVDVKWEKVCIEERQECPGYGPPPPGPGYGAPPSPGYGAPYCAEKIKITCRQEPVLVPVVAPVNLKLPKPVDTCITKEIALPRVKCQQVSEKKCSYAPKVVPGESLLLEKCSASVVGEACAEAVLQLPRQACVAKVKKIKTVYVEEKAAAKSY